MVSTWHLTSHTRELGAYGTAPFLRAENLHLYT